MINTRITDVNEYSKVLELGNTVKREVNKLYKTLELEVDGVFRSMLLLKKKKYAAVTITTGPDGQYVMGKETKGLDLVRRDWCIQSKESGLYILDQILSGDEKEIVVNKIHDHLEKVAAQMRGGKLALDKYVITKGLNKHPNDYPDAKSQAHVYVAKRMINDHKAVGVGDHIPYVITRRLRKRVSSNNNSRHRRRRIQSLNALATPTRLAVATACSSQTWNGTSLTRSFLLFHDCASPLRVHRPVSLPRSWDWIPPSTTTCLRHIMLMMTTLSILLLHRACLTRNVSRVLRSLSSHAVIVMRRQSFPVSIK